MLTVSMSQRKVKVNSITLQRLTQLLEGAFRKTIHHSGYKDIVTIFINCSLVFSKQPGRKTNNIKYYAWVFLVQNSLTE